MKKITIETLKKRGALDNSLEWFKDTFPNGATFKELDEKLIKEQKLGTRKHLWSFASKDAVFKEYTTVTVKDDGIATTSVGGFSISGDDGISASEAYGTSISGAFGVSVTKDNGTATAGNLGRAITGCKSISTTGDGGVSITSASGKAIAGESGIAISGSCGISRTYIRGISKAGDYGTSIAGDWGLAIVGFGGKAKAGDHGILLITGYDKKNKMFKFYTRNINGNTIKANIFYQLNDNNKFVESTINQ